MTTAPAHAPRHAAPGRHARPSAPGPAVVRPVAVRPAPETDAPTVRLAVPRPQVLAPVPARPVVAAPTGLAMKRRNPVGAWLGLPLITLGIYTYVWYYKIHREMAELDRRRALPVAGPVLVLLLLSWTGIATLVTFFNTGNRIADAQRAAGLRPSCNPWIGLLLCFVVGLQVLYYQAELNKIVDSYGVAEGTEIALRA